MAKEKSSLSNPTAIFSAEIRFAIAVAHSGFGTGMAMWCLRIFFFGEGERRAGGVFLQGTDQVVVNNLFRSLGEFGVAIVDGTSDDHYVRVERALVAFKYVCGV